MGRETPQRSETGRGPSRRSGTGEGSRGEVWDRLVDPRGGPGRDRDPRGCPGRVDGLLGRSGTGLGTLGEDRDGSGDPRGRPPGRDGVPRGGPDGSEDSWECSERVGGHSGRSGRGWGLTWRFWTCRGSLGEVRPGSEDSPGGYGRVGVQSGRFETGRGSLGEVWDGSGDPSGG